MQPLTSQKTIAQQREPTWFNSTSNYQEATKNAIQRQTEVFTYLTNAANTDTTLEIESSSLFEVARLAAS